MFTSPGGCLDSAGFDSGDVEKIRAMRDYDVFRIGRKMKDGNFTTEKGTFDSYLISEDSQADLFDFCGNVAVSGGCDPSKILEEATSIALAIAYLTR